MSGVFEEIYKAVKRVPSGKVATYGQIAKMVGLKDVRKVGWALHANRDRGCPCHRVVNKEGRLAANFAFDGPGEQRRRLENEGVSFVDKAQVDMGKHLWQSTNNPINK